MYGHLGEVGPEKAHSLLGLVMQTSACGYPKEEQQLHLHSGSPQPALGPARCGQVTHFPSLCILSPHPRHHSRLFSEELKVVN